MTYLQCNERQGYIPQGNSSKNPWQKQIQVRDKCKYRWDVFPVQGGDHVLDIFRRMFWWGNCMRVVLCCAIILAKSSQEVIAQQSPALARQNSALRCQFCTGMSQPGEVRALDSCRTMDLLEDDKSSGVWRTLLCKAVPEIVPKAGITSCLQSVSLPSPTGSPAPISSLAAAPLWLELHR